LKGKNLLIGCPKLDDLELYRDKLGQILKNNHVLSVTCVYMEIPFEQIMISVKGEKAV
jgi:hypothetical protein